MASSDNLPAILEPWAFRASLADTWISEHFARDTEALTKALQKSLSTRTESVPGIAPLPYTVPFPPSQSPASSFSERRLLAAATSGKISKRKSRATKRSATTFITADPSNFREMVQQVTGAQLGDGHVPMAPIVKPEPQRIGSRLPGCLPTLDTSAFLLDQKVELAGPTSSVENPVWFESSVNDFLGLDLDVFQSQGFPTLESSWRAL